ncbi:MAG TPA: bifunctional diaminohydroxyphosphoribosylaminopyrimidine deaminase/5-amino-6-(5-phosphoribosylamino)uracil reductase RibD [Paenalcaligenes sp.]|nr:bifunctional diaminohydroxyphosphoribosylaminopyrimidine deaminase/5-amino-6-(5-phosphoribosylamino)uracil reductase RibD [Paenalcaligenes sp.]
MSAVLTDQQWMQKALRLAQSVLHLTSPNPRVGCVIVQDHQLVGEGATQRAGGAHAEVMALKQARQQGADLSQCTVYVSLEPCSHYGRTPPCVEALLHARPQRVVVALVDPNPHVSGKGIQALRSAGIPVDVGIGAQEALELNPGFISRMMFQRPFVWLKLASSLDGRSALADGESKWITGAEARLDGHQWRARSCMVLSGIGTIVDDNPLLTVRGLDTPRQPIRAVVDSSFRIDPNAALFNGDPVWIFTTVINPEKTALLSQRNARVIVLAATADGKVNLTELFEFLRAEDINEIHVEAGATLSGALFRQQCVDQLLVYQAPVLLGPGRPMLQLPALPQLADAKRFEFVDVRQVGADVRTVLREPSRWAQLQQILDISLQHS